MKKIIVILAILIGIISYSKMISENEMIRFRIIANSNTEVDQITKYRILDSLREELSYKANTKSEEKKHIIDSIPLMSDKVHNILNNDNYTINYGINYFPQKEYKGKKYDEGYYESLVITLGDGDGSNFWCILFPPICTMPDEDIEYKSIIKETLSKIF